MSPSTWFSVPGDGTRVRGLLRGASGGVDAEAGMWRVMAHGVLPAGFLTGSATAAGGRRSSVAVCDGHRGPDGVGDVALFVGQMVEVVLFLRGGGLSAAVLDVDVERDPADPGHARFIFCHHADGLVFIAVHLEALAAGYVEVGQHVAAGHRGDKRLLGIDARGIGIRWRDDGGRGRCGHGHAAVELPEVLAGVAALGEFPAGIFPENEGFVFRHGGT